MLTGSIYAHPLSLTLNTALLRNEPSTSVTPHSLKLAAAKTLHTYIASLNAKALLTYQCSLLDDSQKPRLFFGLFSASKLLGKQTFVMERLSANSFTLCTMRLNRRQNLPNLLGLSLPITLDNDTKKTFMTTNKFDKFEN